MNYEDSLFMERTIGINKMPI